MSKSLLSSFKNDFNRTIDVYPRTETKNTIGEVETTWPAPSTDTGIKCLLLLKEQNYRRYAGQQVEYTQTTHRVRMDFGATINVGDRIKDEFGVFYDVRFVTNSPGFGGNDDHLLLLVDIIV